MVESSSSSSSLGAGKRVPESSLEPSVSDGGSLGAGKHARESSLEASRFDVVGVAVEDRSGRGSRGESGLSGRRSSRSSRRPGPFAMEGAADESRRVIVRGEEGRREAAHGRGTPVEKASPGVVVG